MEKYFLTNNKKVEQSSIIILKSARPFTFDTADPPKSRMREISSCFLWLQQGLGFICCVSGRVTDVCSRVEPVVGPDSDRHQADRCERAQARKKNLNSTITPSHDTVG